MSNGNDREVIEAGRRRKGSGSKPKGRADAPVRRRPSSEQGGGTPRPFTYISEVFLPELRESGVDEATIHQLTVENPFRAFAR